MSEDFDARCMAEAIELARTAEGDTRPNPLVGCVIVRGGEVIARGYHRRAGEAHAELDALSKIPGSAKGADLYVNLEPCCSHGRTPPCTDAIIEAGIRRVVVGTIDTNPRVQGAGIDKLRAAGIEVVTGVLGNESREVNAPYFKTMEKGLPFVAAKWAMSLDGKIATRTRESAWISGEDSRERVHQLRDRFDAVMVGTRTLQADDPRLTCRVLGGRDPLRIVLDARLSARSDSRVFEAPGTIVFASPDASAEREAELGGVGAVVVRSAVDAEGRFELEPLMRQLLQFEVMSVLVEGGGELLGSLFDAGLIDRVYAFVAPVLIGGREATPAFGGIGVGGMDLARRLSNVRVEQVGDDVLIVGDIR